MSSRRREPRGRRCAAGNSAGFGAAWQNTDPTTPEQRRRILGELDAYLQQYRVKVSQLISECPFRIEPDDDVRRVLGRSAGASTRHRVAMESGTLPWLSLNGVTMAEVLEKHAVMVDAVVGADARQAAAAVFRARAQSRHFFSHGRVFSGSDEGSELQGGAGGATPDDLLRHWLLLDVIFALPASTLHYVLPDCCLSLRTAPHAASTVLDKRLQDMPLGHLIDLVQLQRSHAGDPSPSVSVSARRSARRHEEEHEHKRMSSIAPSARRSARRREEEHEHKRMSSIAPSARRSAGRHDEEHEPGKLSVPTDVGSAETARQQLLLGTRFGFDWEVLQDAVDMCGREGDSDSAFARLVNSRTASVLGRRRAVPAALMVNVPGGWMVAPAAGPNGPRPTRDDHDAGLRGCMRVTSPELPVVGPAPGADGVDAFDLVDMMMTDVLRNSQQQPPSQQQQQQQQQQQEQEHDRHQQTRFVANAASRLRVRVSLDGSSVGRTLSRSFPFMLAMQLQWRKHKRAICSLVDPEYALGMPESAPTLSEAQLESLGTFRIWDDATVPPSQARRRRRRRLGEEDEDGCPVTLDEERLFADGVIEVTWKRGTTDATRVAMWSILLCSVCASWAAELHEAWHAAAVKDDLRPYLQHLNRSGRSTTMEVFALHAPSKLLWRHFSRSAAADGRMYKGKGTRMVRMVTRTPASEAAAAAASEAPFWRTSMLGVTCREVVTQLIVNKR